MSEELAVLLTAAASVGVLHTLLGPDHTVPFIVLARARRWSLRQTLGMTLSCGVGHVLGSVLLGLGGIAAGLSLRNLEAVEAGRGDVAAWLLITGGLVYAAWGLRRVGDGRAGGHRHTHPRAPSVHGLHRDRPHRHDVTISSTTTGWMLFVVFVLGPCEALIPLLMYPAATLGFTEVALVTLVFLMATVGTMAAVVTLGLVGIGLMPAGLLERYAHALAGVTIAACGMGIVLLGL